MTPGRVGAGVLALAVAFLAAACDREKEPQTTEVVTSALNASPKTGDFALEAQNSIRLQTGGLVVNGGDVGARGTGGGPFLSGGVAVDVLTGVQVQTTRNIIADSVRLGTGVRVGDIQTNRFVNGVGATHGNVSGLVPLPAVPASCGDPLEKAPDQIGVVVQLRLAKATSSRASSGRRLLNETPTRGRDIRKATRLMPHSSAALPDDMRPISKSLAASSSFASRSKSSAGRLVSSSTESS
jgi:hypothetical protein